MMDQFVWQYNVMTVDELLLKGGVTYRGGISEPYQQGLQRALVSMSRENWGYSGNVDLKGQIYMIFSKMVPKEPIQ